MTLRILPHLRSPLFPHLHRGFRTTTTRDDFHFDTHHFVQRLEREGLNRAQAEGIMSAMAEVIDESIRNMTSNMVTKTDHEKVLVPTLYSSCAYHQLIANHGWARPPKKKQHYTQQVDFAQLKSELQLTEKHDLTMIKAENDRLFTDIEKLRQRLREEVSRTQAGVRLDLNLEKGRIREEASRQELKMKEVDTRIEQEIAGLRAAIQSSKVGDYLLRLGELIHDLGVRRRHSSTWLGLVSCVFGSVKCDQLTDCLCSDWLHGASHGIPTFPGVIGSFPSGFRCARSFSGTMFFISTSTDLPLYHICASRGYCISRIISYLRTVRTRACQRKIQSIKCIKPKVSLSVCLADSVVYGGVTMPHSLLAGVVDHQRLGFRMRPTGKARKRGPNRR